MRSRVVLVVGSFFLAFSLTGCATATAGAGIASPDVSSELSATTEPTAAVDSEAAAARLQAEAWLDTAALPPGAVRSDAVPASFTSYTGWPCGPIEELEAFWVRPGATVSDTANWLIENPAAGLETTAFSPVSDSPDIDSAIVGFILEPNALEGIVYTVVKTREGVAIRAEIGALTESAVCPTPPGGGMWGAPGQG